MLVTQVTRCIRRSWVQGALYCCSKLKIFKNILNTIFSFTTVQHQSKRLFFPSIFIQILKRNEAIQLGPVAVHSKTPTHMWGNKSEQTPWTGSDLHFSAIIQACINHRFGFYTECLFVFRRRIMVAERHKRDNRDFLSRSQALC